MLRLSELSGFIVCGYLFGKIYCKIIGREQQQKTPSQSNYGRGDLGEWLRGSGIYITFRYTGLSN